jgi:hypothetical protein
MRCIGRILIDPFIKTAYDIGVHVLQMFIQTKTTQSGYVNTDQAKEPHEVPR